MGQSVRGDAPRIAAIPRAIELANVPGEGFLTCRFLGSYSGIETHYVKGRGRGVSVHCIGAQECPRTTHAIPIVWKGYAAVEVWNGDMGGLWIPSVLEVTERLHELMNGRQLRGELWELWRRSVNGGRREVDGQCLGVATTTLREAFSVELVLQRIYRTPRLRWVQGPWLAPREYMLPSEDEAPPNVQPPKSEIDKPVNRQTFRQLAEAAGQTFKRPSQTQGKDGAQ